MNLTKQEKWWSKYLCDTIFSPRWILGSDVEKILQEHKERIMKEVKDLRKKTATGRVDYCPTCEGYLAAGECDCFGFNAAIDAVINHLKK